MSAAHLRSGRSAAKSLPSRFPATGRSCELSVVRGTNFLFVFARIPASRITFATVFSHAASPSALSTRKILGLPYTPRFPRCAARTFLVSSSRRSSRAPAGRSRQA